MDGASEGHGRCLPGDPQSPDFWVLVPEAVQAQGRDIPRKWARVFGGPWLKGWCP